MFHPRVVLLPSLLPFAKKFHALAVVNDKHVQRGINPQRLSCPKLKISTLAVDQGVVVFDAEVDAFSMSDPRGREARIGREQRSPGSVLFGRELNDLTEAESTVCA